MKTKSTFRSFLTITASTLLAVSYTHAADFTWDNSNAAGIQVPAAGTWTNGGAGWTTGGTTLVNWAAANVAVFGGADGTYAVTVGGSFSAQKISFVNSGYTLSAASAQVITLTSSAGTTTLPQLAVIGGKSATIGSNVTVNVQQTTYIGAAGSNAGGTLNIEGGTVGTSTNLGSSVTIDGNGTVVNVKTGGTLRLLNSGNSNTNAAIVVGQLAGSNATLNVQGGTVTANQGNSAGTGGLFVGNVGLGTVTLTTGAINVFPTTSGVTFGNSGTAAGNNLLNLDGGTLTTSIVRKGANAVATATFNFNGGTLQANASNATFMQGLTTANVLAGGAKIDTQANNITIAQALLDGTGGGGLTKSGTGSLTLAGSNTYNGATTVNSGTLKLSSAATNASNVTVTSGAAGAFVAVADGQHVSAGSLTLNNSSKLAIDYGTTAPSTTTAPLKVVNFTLGTGIGTQIEGSTPPSVGPVYPLVNWTGTGPADTSAFGSVVLPGFIGTLSVDVPNKILSVTYALPVEKSWNTGNGTWDTTSPNWSPSTYNDGDIVLFGDAPSAGANPAVTLNSNFTPNSVTMTSTSRGYNISGTGSIGGFTGLTLGATNTQTHTLATANTFTGPTAINGGTLRLGDGGAIGSLSATSAVSVALGATFAVNQNDTVTQGTEFGAISGDGGFAQIGTGTTALNLANTFTGGLKVKGGTVVLGNNTAAGTGTIDFDTGGATNATVQLSGAITAIANPITVTSGSIGTNTIANLGTGTLALNGAITINTGTTLTVDNSSSNNSAMDLGTGLITGDGGIIATGTSTNSFGFKGANTYTGGTTLGGAGLFIPTGSSTGSGAGTTDGVFGTGTLTLGSISMRSTNTADITIGNTLILGGNLTAVTATAEKNLIFSGPATLTGNRTITSQVGATVAGKGLAFLGVIGDGGNNYGITKEGAGVLLLNGANTYAGITTVNAGTLSITDNAALGSTAGATTINGGNGTNSVILYLSGATSDLTIAEPLNFFANTTGRARLSQSSAQNHTLSGPINVSSDTNLAQFYSDAGSVTISGDITGTMTNGALFSVRGTSTNPLNRILGSLNLIGGNFVKTDSGTWLVGAPGKTYSWTDTVVAAGTLKMGLANVLPSATTLTLGNATGGSFPFLDLNGSNQTVGSIIYNGQGVSTGIRTITSATPAVLTVNNATDSITTGTNASTNNVVLTGALSLTKQGAGRLDLNGVNTYSGDTTVNEGILSLTKAASALDANTGNDASAVSIAATAGATLDLAYSGTDEVDKLFIGGVQKAAGVWGSATSGAANTDSKLTGTGTLTVATGPAAGYTAWAATNAGGEGAQLDFDKDGVSNGVEYFMNAPAGFTANPQLSTTEPRTITWPNGGNIPASAYGAQFVIQTSSNLTNWVDVDGGDLTTNTDGPGGSLTYALTGGSPRFVRLKVKPN